MLPDPGLSRELRINKEKVIIFFDKTSEKDAYGLHDYLNNELPRLESFFEYTLTDSVHVYLYSPENYKTLQHDWRIPDWGQALAVPDNNLIILNSRSADNVNIYANLGQILSHELTHIFMAKKAGDNERTIPVWFKEGCAVWFSGERRPMDMLSRALLTNSLIDFDDIEDVLRYDPYRAELAYDQSLSAILYLIRQNQEIAISRILAAVKSGNDFSDAFSMVTGQSVYQFETDWENQVKPAQGIEWARYADSAIWLIIIPLLFLIAIVIKKIRAEKKLNEWDKEENSE